MSTEHDVRVVRLGAIRKHENADTLEVTEVEGRPCVVRAGQWTEGDWATYVPIDSLVPVADPRFAFLVKSHAVDATGRARVRAVRLRGTFSMGLLVEPPDGAVPDDDVREALGIEVYEPPIPTGGGSTIRDPGFLPVYDVESVRKWGERVLRLGEEVVLEEKVHGANGKWTFYRDQTWCGSRTQFYPLGESMWGRIGTTLEEKLRTIPGIAIYGEVFGQVQDLRYGCNGANVTVFDVLDVQTRRWWNYDERTALLRDLNIPQVPLLYRGPWSPDLLGLAEGDSVLAATHGAKHVREGWVVRPVEERVHEDLGRVLLKCHGQGYLTRKNG